LHVFARHLELVSDRGFGSRLHILQVNRVDQSRINEFGRLNSRKHEIRDEIAECKVRTMGHEPE